MSDNDRIRALLNAAITVRENFNPTSLGGLEALGVQALMLLQIEGRMGVMELTDKLAASQPNVSTAMKRLERDGLVRLRLDPLDARRREFEISAAGSEAVKQMLARRGTQRQNDQ